LSSLFIFHLSALLLAFLFDWILGDPPNRFHPTAWMGTFIGAIFKKRPSGSPALEFIFGMTLTLTGALIFCAAGYGLEILFLKLPIWIGVILQAILLKTTFSLRGLWRASGEIHAALASADLPEARRLLSWHLVSRDTSTLDEARISAATIESVAENASDSVVAPLFFYALGGLPLALLYRFVNTADAMLGYRDKSREWVGKFPARFDDVLNYIPARLTGIMIVLAAGKKFSSAWRTLRRDARLTESPNAGYPMSAIAGALEIELEKTGVYSLGKGFSLPSVQDIHSARILIVSASLLSFFVFLPMLFLRW